MDLVTIATILGLPVAVFSAVFGVLQYLQGRAKCGERELEDFLIARGSRTSTFAAGAAGVAAGVVAAQLLQADLPSGGEHLTVGLDGHAGAVVANLSALDASVPGDLGEAHHALHGHGWLVRLLDFLTP